MPHTEGRHRGHGANTSAHHRSRRPRCRIPGTNSLPDGHRAARPHRLPIGHACTCEHANRGLPQVQGQPLPPAETAWRCPLKSRPDAEPIASDRHRYIRAVKLGAKPKADVRLALAHGFLNAGYDSGRPTAKSGAQLCRPCINARIRASLRQRRYSHFGDVVTQVGFCQCHFQRVWTMAATQPLHMS